MAPDFRIVLQRGGLRGAAAAMRSLPLLLVLLLVLPASAEDASYRQASLRTDAVSRRAEQRILKLLNRERSARGLQPLVADEGLTRAARLHSRGMAVDRQLTHQLRGEAKLTHRLNQAGLFFNASGENVALASGAEEAHQALMHSPGHRANILRGSFNAVGIGVVRSEGRIYVTQEFARLLPRVSAADAEQSVARSLNQLRRDAGATSLRRLPAPELRERACEMADADRVNPRAAMLPRADNAIAFTASDLNDVTRPLGGLSSRRASAFSVGACYRASRSFENPVYWVLLATYR